MLFRNKSYYIPQRSADGMNIWESIWEPVAITLQARFHLLYSKHKINSDKLSTWESTTLACIKTKNPLGFIVLFLGAMVTDLWFRKTVNNEF